jgi:hypothetical protein
MRGAVIILAGSGERLDFAEAQRRSAEFAVIVTGWIDDAMNSRPGPAPGEVEAAVKNCFPGAELRQPPRLVGEPRRPGPSPAEVRAAVERYSGHRLRPPEEPEQ